MISWVSSVQSALGDDADEMEVTGAQGDQFTKN